LKPVTLDEELLNAKIEYVALLKSSGRLGGLHHAEKKLLEDAKIYFDELRGKKKKQLEEEMHQAG